MNMCNEKGPVQQSPNVIGLLFNVKFQNKDDILQLLTTILPPIC